MNRFLAWIITILQVGDIITGWMVLQLNGVEYGPLGQYIGILWLIPAKLLFLAVLWLLVSVLPDEKIITRTLFILCLLYALVVGFQVSEITVALLS